MIGSRIETILVSRYGLVDPVPHVIESVDSVLLIVSPGVGTENIVCRILVSIGESSVTRCDIFLTRCVFGRIRCGAACVVWIKVLKEVRTDLGFNDPVIFE